MTEYISNADYRRQKSALTRAINSKDPLKVLVAVEKAIEEWSGKCWPDAWSRWSCALYDAWLAYERGEVVTRSNIARFSAAYERFA